MSYRGEVVIINYEILLNEYINKSMRRKLTKREEKILDKLHDWYDNHTFNEEFWANYKIGD